MKITRCVFHAAFAVLGLLTFFVVALPTARAQIVPVSLAKDMVADSKIPSGNVVAPLPPLPPLPRREPRRAVKVATPRAFFVLSAGVYAPRDWTCSNPNPGCLTFTNATPWRGHFCVCRRRHITLRPRYSRQESTFWDGKWHGPSVGTKSGGCRRWLPWRATWRGMDTLERTHRRIDALGRGYRDCGKFRKQLTVEVAGSDGT